VGNYERIIDLPVKDGFVEADAGQDIMKMAVFERHHETGTKGLGFLKGFGFKKGAMAQTVSHDAHNLLVAGTNDEDMATAFLKHKTPRKAPFTREEEAAMNAFVSACHTLGFWGARELPYGRRCNRQGTGYLEYNAYMDSIEFISRVRKPGLFDAFYEREIVAKVFTKMHSILNDGRRDDYSAAQSIQKVTQQVEKSMNEIFG
jgi:hypothetical protein